MPNKINVQIIQPVVPTYRVPLFESLLNDDRFEVHIMAAKKEPYGVTSVEPFHENINLEHDIAFFFKRFMWQKHLRLLPEMQQGDVLIINGNVKFLSNYPLIIEAKKRKVAIVWWGHGWSSTSNRLSFYLRSKVMKVANRLLLYTEREKQILVDHGFDDRSIHYMNNTICTDSIFKLKQNITSEKIKDFKEKHKITNKKILLFTGRLKKFPKTSLDVALHALKALNISKNEYVLVVIGDGSEKINLQGLAQKLGLQNNVLFHGAIYDEAKLAPWYLSADCFVFPGAIGLSLLHSFSYGLPVVTHDELRLHNPEIAAFKNGVNGLLFTKGDVDDLKTKIKILCSGQRSFREAAIRTITGEYSYDQLIRRVKECITDAAVSVRT